MKSDFDSLLFYFSQVYLGPFFKERLAFKNELAKMALSNNKAFDLYI